MATTKANENAPSAKTEQANIAPATEIDPSGAPVQIVPDVDMNHPAVDADPRKGTTEAQNRIDFNDPNKSGAEAVADMLNAQGVPTKVEPDEAAEKKADK